MKQLTVQKKLKIAFVSTAIFAGVMLFVIFLNMRKIANESARASTALNILTQVETIISNLTILNEGFYSTPVSPKNNVEQRLDSITILVKQAQQNLASIKNIDAEKQQLLQTFIALSEQNITALKKLFAVVKDGKIAMATQPYLDTKTYLQKINEKRLEIENKERVIIKQTNEVRNAYTKVSSWILVLFAVSLSLILINGNILISQNFLKSEIINTNLLHNTTLLNNISNAIISVDKNFCIKTWNKYAENLYGLQEADVINKKIDEIINLSSENSSWNINIVQHQKNWSGEIQQISKGGMVIESEVNVSTLYNDKKEFDGAIFVIYDITKRKKLQDDLLLLTKQMESDNKTKANDLNLLFERITEAFVILDNNWNYTFLNNKAKQLHNIDDSLIGKNFWEINFDLVGEPFYDALLEAKKTKKVIKKEFYYQPKDKWFEDVIYPSNEGVSIYYNEITNRKKAELQLIQLHNRLSFHLTNTPLAVLEFDSDLNILHWSKKAEEIFGWSAEDIGLGNIKMDKMLHRDDAAPFFNNLHQLATNSGLDKTIEVRCIKKNGDVIYCEWYNSFLKEENNSNGVMLSLIKDITKSKLTELELADTEAKFRSLAEASIVGVYIRKEEKLLYANPKFEKLFGYSSYELYNTVDANDLIFKEDKIIIDKHRSDYEAKKTTSLHYEFRGIHKSGKSFYAEVFGSNTVLNGENVTIGTVLDITERVEAVQKIKHSEAALQYANERFELVAKATQDCVWDWDIKNNRLTGNEPFYNLFEESIGTPLNFEDFLLKVHESDRKDISENYYKALKNKNILLTEEFRFTQNDGKEKTLFDRAYILYDDKNKAYRMLGAMQDITALKDAQRKLENEKDLSVSIINSLPGTFYIFNKEGKFKLWNKNFELVTKYSKEEIETLTPINFVAEKNMVHIYNTINQIYEKGNGSVELELITKEKEAIQYYLTGISIMYENEVCIMGVGIDISEKTKAEEKLQQSNEAFRELAAKLETIRENERTHMAREIHDELGQQLTGLKMDISWINKKVQSDDRNIQEKMMDITKLIDKTVITVRRIATELRPSILDDLGLIAAMEWHCEEFEKRHEIKSNFTSNVNNITVTPEVATGLFRIFQESFTNVLRHANASHIQSSFMYNNNSITLSIVDNGKGFNEAEVAKKKTLGLLGMKERVFLINGTYEIKGDAGVGTSVIINVPLN